MKRSPDIAGKYTFGAVGGMLRLYRHFHLFRGLDAVLVSLRLIWETHQKEIFLYRICLQFIFIALYQYR